MIEYSVIIPHKNIPKLLQRCLDSIPQRADLEVIVVDDNSDPNLVNFEQFPGLKHPQTTVIFDKSGKGAGRARNIGLQHAKGKWILFADADDYFNYCIRDILDEYREDDADIVFFSVSSVDCETYINVGRADFFMWVVRDYFQNKEIGELNFRYVLASPWGKIIKRSFLEKNGIDFQETQISNDVRFSYISGYYASKITVDRRALYCLTYRPFSIQHSITDEKILEKVSVLTARDRFFIEHCIPLPLGLNYIDILADLKEMGKERLYSQCMDFVASNAIPQSIIEDKINKELKRRRILHRDSFWLRFRDRLAIRTRIRNLFRII